MAHPQTSPRGYIAKQRIDVGGNELTANSTALLLSAGLALSGETTDVITQDSTAVLLAAGIALSGQASTNAITQNSTAVTIPDGLTLSGLAHANAITQNSTALILPGQVQVNAARYIGGNSTGYLFTSEAAAPDTDGGDYKWTLIVNSTGVAGIAINTTGTTWSFVRMTSEINTT